MIKLSLVLLALACCGISGCENTSEECASMGDLVIAKDKKIYVVSGVEIRACNDRTLRVWVKPK